MSMPGFTATYSLPPSAPRFSRKAVTQERLHTVRQSSASSAALTRADLANPWLCYVLCNTVYCGLTPNPECVGFCSAQCFGPLTV